MPGAVRPPDVQVLDQEAGRRSSAPGCASSPRRSSWRIPASTNGNPVRPSLPRLEQLGVSAGSSYAIVRELRPQVAPGRVGPVPEHVGVELAPGQLGRERGRPWPRVRVRRQVGQQRARVDLADLQVRREPGGAGQVGPVAAARRSRSMPSSRNACQRRARPASPAAGRSGTPSPTSGRSSESTRRAQRRSRGDGGRARPAVRAPGAGEGGEHLVRRAAAGGQRARARRRTACRWPPSATPSRPSASRTRSSRRRPNGVDSALTWTLAAPTSRASSGSTCAGDRAGRPARRRTARTGRAGRRRARPAAPDRPTPRARGSSTNSGRTDPPDAASWRRDEGRVVGQPQVAPQPEDGVGHRMRGYDT